MTRKTSIDSRRDVVAGIGGLALYAAARPAMAQAPSGAPIKIGQALALTGPFAQTGLIHKIVSEYYVDRLNKNGGLLGRPVQYVLYDDQSKPDVSRTLYEKLITSDKVDLILGPYGTASILAAMGVAARYNKVFIQNTMGVPALATYKWHFSALVSARSRVIRCRTRSSIAMPRQASRLKRSRSSRTNIPRRRTWPRGREELPRRAAEGRRISNTKSAISTRGRSRPASRRRSRPDVRRLPRRRGQPAARGADPNRLPPEAAFLSLPLGAARKLGPAAGATWLTNFEERAAKRGNRRAFAPEANGRPRLPYPHVDTQAGNEYCRLADPGRRRSTATKSLEDKKLAEWLDAEFGRHARRQARLQRQMAHQRPRSCSSSARSRTPAGSRYGRRKQTPGVKLMAPEPGPVAAALRHERLAPFRPPRPSR